MALLRWILQRLRPRPRPAARPVDPSIIGRVVPERLWGMHLIRVWMAAWPALDVGLYRLHGATPRWSQLHLGPGVWADDTELGTGLSRIDAALQFRDLNSPDTPALYVLGGGGDAPNGGWPVWVGPSTRYAAWAEHCRHVAERFGSRIDYWQIWNEADSAHWFTGSMAELVELTRIAAEQVRAVAPWTSIVAPSFTGGGYRTAAASLREFVNLGGHAHCDILTIHTANSSTPELDLPHLAEARAIARSVDRPLWVTEGHPYATADRSLDPAIAQRTYLSMLIAGVQSFGWYSWEFEDYDDIPGPWVTLATWTGQPNASGRALHQLQHMLAGQTVRDVTCSDGLWTLRTDAGTIAWTETGTRVWNGRTVTPRPAFVGA
jgi:hypothetical protein